MAAEPERRQLLGPDGRPISSLTEFAQLGPGIRDRGSFVEIDKSALDQVRTQRARRLAVSSVPSTPRTLTRDIGGLAVGKGHGRYPHITMDMCRDIRERAPILAPIHQAIQYKVRKLAVRWPGQEGTIGLRVVHKDHYAPGATPPAGFDRYIKQFEQVLWNPSPSYGINTLGAALTGLMDDLLTINRPTVEIIPALVDRKRIVQWRPVDGGIIWPTLAWVEKWMADNPTWAVGYEKGRIEPEQLIDAISASIHHDLHGAEYVLVREGIAEAVYPPGRLIVAPIMNRTDIRFAGYPPSHVEQAIGLVSAFISTFDYNATYFTKGMMAEFILGLPSDLHDDDVDHFIDMFREATQGGGRAWQPPIIPLPHGKDGITKIDLKQSNRDMMFELWMSLLIALTTAIYRTHTSTINAKPWDGGSAPKLSEGTDESINLANEEGLQGDFGHLIENVLNPMAQRCHPDLIVVAEYGLKDPKKTAEIYESRAKVDMSRNDVRLERGKLPRGFWMSDQDLKTAGDDEKKQYNDNPWNWPTDPTFAGAIASANQLAQQAQQMAAYGQQGEQPPGQDDGFGGQDDGFGAQSEDQKTPYGQPAAGADDTLPNSPGLTAGEEGMKKARMLGHRIHQTLVTIHERNAP